jgi:hypothetical protein
MAELFNRQGRRETLRDTHQHSHWWWRFDLCVQPGAEIEVELPFGTYQLQHNSHRRVFVPTGMGIAPFLPVFAALETSVELNTAELLLSFSHIMAAISSPCRAPWYVSAAIQQQRVSFTGGWQKCSPAWNSTQQRRTSLSGAPAMMDDCRTILAIAGATQVLIEPFWGTNYYLPRKRVLHCFLNEDRCRLHNEEQRLSVGINDWILTEDLSTNKWGYSHGLNNQWLTWMEAYSWKEASNI